MIQSFFFLMFYDKLTKHQVHMFSHIQVQVVALL
jgi:hypothetical protein